jgi:hypothetical protein
MEQESGASKGVADANAVYGKETRGVGVKRPRVPGRCNVDFQSFICLSEWGIVS